jgi:glutamate-1-semialdehyde 2,1-aminomutase
MFTLFFSDTEIKNYADVQKCNHTKFSEFYVKLLENGIYLAPSQFETNFISAAHKPDDLSKTLEIVNKVLKAM